MAVRDQALAIYVISLATYGQQVPLYLLSLYRKNTDISRKRFKIILRVILLALLQTFRNRQALKPAS